MSGKIKCEICERKGRRQCPALAGFICTNCCGLNRGSEIACPPQCPHFPFGINAYDLCLQIETSWMQKTVKYLLKHMDRDRLLEIAERMAMKTGDELEDVDLGVGMGFAVCNLVFIERGFSGKTLAESWEEQDWMGLNNDERIMMKYRRHTLPAVLEAQGILNGQSTRCIDLLDPEKGEFVVFDRGMAKSAVKFTRLLTWVTHYPHFSRVEGAALHVPVEFFPVFYEEIQSQVSKGSGPVSPTALKRYMARHFQECCDLLTLLTEESRKRLFKSMDLHQCRAFYEIQGEREAVEEVLESKPEFEWEDREPEPGDPPGAEYYCWLRKGESKEIEKSLPKVFQHEGEEGGVGILGTLRLSPGEMMIETFSKMKFAFAKEMVENYFGSRVKLIRETVVDIADQMLERDRTEGEEIGFDEKEAPAHSIPLEVEKELLQKFYRRHYQKFLDDKVPAIDNHTPREAAKNPAMRPWLIELMKQHVQGLEQMSRERGIELNIDWVLEELGLHELL